MTVFVQNWRFLLNNKNSKINNISYYATETVKITKVWTVLIISPIITSKELYLTWNLKLMDSILKV